jgi:hypothetical protein
VQPHVLRRAIKVNLRIGDKAMKKMCFTLILAGAIVPVYACEKPEEVKISENSKNNQYKAGECVNPKTFIPREEVVLKNGQICYPANGGSPGGCFGLRFRSDWDAYPLRLQICFDIYSQFQPVLRRKNTTDTYQLSVSGGDMKKTYSWKSGESTFSWPIMELPISEKINYEIEAGKEKEIKLYFYSSALEKCAGKPVSQGMVEIELPYPW